jgi:hypothetical protein
MRRGLMRGRGAHIPSSRAALSWLSSSVAVPRLVRTDRQLGRRRRAIRSCRLSSHPRGQLGTGSGMAAPSTWRLTDWGCW